MLLYIAGGVAAYVIAALFTVRTYHIDCPPREKRKNAAYVKRWGEHISMCLTVGFFWPFIISYFFMRPGFVWFFTDPKVRRAAKAKAATEEKQQIIKDAYESALDIYRESNGDKYLISLAASQLALAQSIGKMPNFSWRDADLLEQLKKDGERSG